MNDLLAFAHNLADATEPLIRHYFRSPLAGLAYKDDASPVTKADKEAEQLMRQMIEARFPEHGILGEEHGAHQPDAAYQWILDPIDGTKAFSCGRLDFGTLIGLKHHDIMVLGVLNQPITQERWIGCAGVAQFNGSAIATNHEARLKTARFATTSHTLFSASQQQQMLKVANTCGLSQYGGDCYNYGLLAAGYIDVIMEAGLNMYDIAPLLPILHGSGAKLSDWQGNALTLDRSRIDIIVCANKLLHDEVLGLIHA